MADNASGKTAAGDETRPVDAETDNASGEMSPENGAPEAASPAGSDSGSGTGLEIEVANLREALLRAHAEMDNVRKRSEREVEKSRRFALERFIKDLVPVIDSLDQALVNGEPEEVSDDAPEGMRLVHRQLIDALARHGLEVLNPDNEPFDPSWHEAMTMQPSEDVAPNTVIQVLQKGFKLHDRLLRPARVIVSRKPD